VVTFGTICCDGRQQVIKYNILILCNTSGIKFDKQNWHQEDLHFLSSFDWETSAVFDSSFLFSNSWDSSFLFSSLCVVSSVLSEDRISTSSVVSPLVTTVTET